MDFDRAIAAHSSWNRKLADYLKKPDHSLRAVEIADENRCELGKWIAGEGQQFADLPEYTTLKSEHARFHRAAAEIVERANSGQKVVEEAALGSRSEFVTASSVVVRSIVQMKSKVAIPVGVRK